MMTHEPNDDYLAYMLRLWRVNPEAGPVWRASLEDSLTGDRLGFAGLEELFEFLRVQTGMIPASNSN